MLHNKEVNHDPRNGNNAIPTRRSYHNRVRQEEEYDAIIGQPQKFRALLDRDYQLNPENYPETFEQGYKLHDKAVSVKLGVTTRRIKLRNSQAWTVHPSFVMPRMTGYTEEVAKA